MELPIGPPEQRVIAEIYGESVILVPQWLREHSEELVDNQKYAINLGAVSIVTRVKRDINVGWAFRGSLACFYLNIPPIGREWLHIKYPGFIPFSWIETRAPPRVVAGIFSIPRDKWLTKVEDSNLMRNVMIRHSIYFKSLNSSPLMYLPLKSGMSHHTKIYHLPEEGPKGPSQVSTFELSDTEEPGFWRMFELWDIEEPGFWRTFKLSDTEEPGWFYGKRTFKLSDKKQLVSFCRTRFESLSKEVVDEITRCWLQRLAQRLLTPQIESALRLDLSKQKKRGVIMMATRLLLWPRLDQAKGQPPWIEDLREASTGAVKILEGHYCGKQLEDVLSSLFYVAQCHEDYQPTLTNKLLIEWQYIARAT